MAAGAEVAAVVEPVAGRRGLVLIDATLRVVRGRGVLQVVVDRPGGVTLGDVEGFHRELEIVLSATEMVPRDCAIEVSSPGAERPLRTERDFRLFTGRPVRLAAREPVDGRREWDGWLAGLEEDRIVVRLDDGTHVRVPLSLVAWARLRLP